MRGNYVRKIVWGIVMLGFGTLLVLNSVQMQDTAHIVRIGVLDSEQGAITQGAELAVWQINQAGGLRGADGSLISLELFVEDGVTEGDLEEAIGSLGQAGVVAVLGPATTEDVLNNLAALQNLGVPILIPAVGDTIIATDTSGLLFRMRAAERLQGAALADVLVNNFGIRQIVTIQLDGVSTGGRVGLSIALGAYTPVPQETTLLLYGDRTIDNLVSETLTANPPAVAVYGPSSLASELYLQLRAAGWFGIFAYNHVEDTAFREAIPRSQLNGILGTTTWPMSATDEASSAFLNAYVRAFGKIPGPIEAAAYDAVYLIATALAQPNSLATNLVMLRDVRGVQGTLNPAGLVAHEISDTVAVVRLNQFGGLDIISRYAGSVRFVDGGEAVNTTPLLLPTATPEGVVLTIKSAVQNVRSGPGMEYDVLGQVEQGQQIRIIGATTDFSWVVIEYRGQQGWLATYLLDVWGDRSTVPVVPIPPTPTPGPPTATPTLPPIPDVIIMGASPSNIVLGVATTIMVTVANVGGGAAGPFAVAATFPPDNSYVSAHVTGLAAGAQQVVSLPVTLSSQVGNFNVVIVADLNGEVAETTIGEDNNDDYVFYYRVDRPVMLYNTVALVAGSFVDLEGNVLPTYDIQYTAAGLNVANPTCTGTANCIGLFNQTGLNWDTVHYGLIGAAQGINATFVPNAALTPGVIIGVLTAEGRRAVLRVDSINPGIAITLTYRVYQ